MDCLNVGVPFKTIAKRIGKSATTVSREVKRHITITKTAVVRKDKGGNILNTLCPLLSKPPFVCNSCKRRRSVCAFDKSLYYAKDAQKEYELTLVSSREGIPLNSEKFYSNDRIITAAVQRGQHIYHIIKSNNLGVSSATVYRHIKLGYSSLASIDLPRAVKFKPRKSKPAEKIPQKHRIGRAYTDFCAFKEENNLSSWVEMDTVIGVEGGKALLTFDFVFCNFMFGILLQDKSSASVSGAIIRLKEKLLENGLKFGDIFTVILTDNGGEFSDIFTVELDLGGEPETKLFFCEPYSSWQKPHVEKTHTGFRDIVPKGSSFDGFTQSTINMIFSHVNSVKRKNLNGKSAFDVFSFLYSIELLTVLGIEPVPPEQVIQAPLLLITQNHQHKNT